MRNYFKYPLIFLAIILCLWTIGKLTETFILYNSPTPANEPTIETDSRFFASNLVHPKLMNFICFYAEDKFSGRQLRTFRICAQEGDILEIKTGNLFVNKKLFDLQINVQHNYKISRIDYEKIKSLLQIAEESLIESSGDSIIIPLSDRFASTHKLTHARVILPNNYEDEEIMRAFSHHWNQDNFGPVSIPTGKYFVLGDNRNNALDSRYLGFIDKSEVVATVLWK